MPSDLNWGAVLEFERFALFKTVIRVKYLTRELIAQYCGRKAQPLGGQPIAKHSEKSGHQSD